MAKSGTTVKKKIPVPVYEGVVEIGWSKADPELFAGSEPKRQYPGDAGLDLTCSHHQQIAPGAKAQIPTNIVMAIPAGYFGLILARSSTFINKQLFIHQGIVDSGFRGEVKVMAHNPNPTRSVQIMEGDRLAQLLILPVIPCVFTPYEKLEDLPPGDRDTAGFGSTGGQSSPRIG